MSVPDLLNCGHSPTVSTDGTAAIGYNPDTGGTLCDPCVRALPPQPVTIHFLGTEDEPPYTRTGLDTDKITDQPGYKVHWEYFIAKDGKPTQALWKMLDGSVKYIHVLTDIFGLHRFNKEG